MDKFPDEFLKKLLNEFSLELPITFSAKLALENLVMDLPEDSLQEVSKEFAWLFPKRILEGISLECPDKLLEYKSFPERASTTILELTYGKISAGLPKNF